MIAPTVRRSLRGRSESRPQAKPPARTNTMPRPDGAAAGAVGIPAPARESMIREAAYFRAERRGFAPGAELEDWFAAEREIDRFLSTG